MSKMLNKASPKANMRGRKSARRVGLDSSTKVTICTEKEESGIVSLVNRRAIINKKDIEAEAIRYIKVEKM